MTTSGADDATRGEDREAGGGLAAKLVNQFTPVAPQVEEDRDGRDEIDEDDDEKPRLFAPAFPAPGALDSTYSDMLKGSYEEEAVSDRWKTPRVARPAVRGGGDEETYGEMMEADDVAVGTGSETANGLVFADRATPLAATATKKNHVNRRIVIFAAAAILLLVGFWMSGKKKAPAAEEQKNGAATLKATGQPAMQFTNTGESELGTPKPLPSLQQPPPPAEPVVTPPPPPAPVVAPVVQQEKMNEEFAVVLRAGDQSEQTAAANEKIKAAQKKAATQGTAKAGAAAKNDERFQRGTRVSLQLLDPLRSGIASVVTAQVLNDVVGKDGEVLIPAGSRAAIPFFPSENQGRMLNNLREPALFLTPDGTELPLYGTIKGQDNLTGITGKVTKIGGQSLGRRILGGVARVGSRAAGDILDQGGDLGDEAQYEINRTTGGFNGPLFDRSRQVVSVSAGTVMTFELSWK